MAKPSSDASAMVPSGDSGCARPGSSVADANEAMRISLICGLHGCGAFDAERAVHRELPETQPLQRAQQKKAWHDECVAPPQPARFAQKPKRPFETASLDGSGRLPLEAGVEVERRADADKHRGVQPAAHMRHPEFLLGTAKPHPDDIRAGPVDPLRDLGFLLRAKFVKRRRVGSSDPRIREFFEKPRLKPLQGLVRRAIKEMAPALVLAGIEQGKHEVRSIDAVAGGMAGPLQRPYQRHAVRRDEERAVVDRPKFRVALAPDDAMRVTDADIFLLSLGDGGIDARGRGLEV